MVEELLRRQQASEARVLDDVVAEDIVNHAAGLQRVAAVWRES